MRSIDNQFYQSPEWKKCRRSYLQFVNGRCERCLAKGLHVPARIVHHKIYMSAETFSKPEVAYNFDNLEALCQRCHNEEHFGEKKEPRWKIVNGKIKGSDL